MAATADMQRLINDLRAVLPGALLSGIQAAIFQAYDDFFDFTNVWTEDVDIALVNGQRVYTLATPAQGRFNRLVVLFDSQDTSEKWADRAEFTPPSAIKIASTPKAGPTWVARLSKKLATVDADNNPDAPDAFLQKYREAIYAGARSILHAQTGMPWADTKSVVFYGQKFLAEKTKARIDKIKANVVGQTNWTFPMAYSTGRQRGY